MKGWGLGLGAALRMGAIALSLSGGVSAFAQLTDEETKGVARALNLWNLSIADLGYEKSTYKDRYRLPLVDLALSAPLDGLAEVMKLHAAARRAGSDLTPVVSAAWDRLNMAPRVKRMPVKLNPAGLDKVPAACRVPIGELIDLVAEAQGYVNLALSALTERERADLLRSLPQIANIPAARLPQAASGTLLPREKAFELLDKVDMKLIAQASLLLTKDLRPIVERLRAVAPKVVIAKPIGFVAGHTPVLIGSTGDDRLTCPENGIVVDFRGNDSYSGRPGTGICGCGVLIDLGGSDAFDLPDYAGGFGMLGCGVVVDLGGNDRVFAKSCSVGAALAGFGAFFKEGGNDTYRAGSCTQGAAMFGVGVLLDTKGADRYDATDFAQGSGMTEGFGWLIDREGDDFYSIGGRVSGAPLDPKSWECFGQGAGQGFREDSGGESGGIGMLSDFKGDDVYKGGMYCQGASYWFSVGALLDDSGNDTYTADYYAQAAAMHVAAAYLVDLSGDDIYTVRTGAMQAIGHDGGVAMLLDREGDDVYSGRDSQPGKGAANGIGIFLDSAGNDRYFGPVAVASGSNGMGSIGLFVDLGGSDRFAEGPGDGGVSLGGYWGIALDHPQIQLPGSPAQTPAHVRPKPGTAKTPPDAELERIFAKAAQWGVGSLQHEVDDNVDKLVAIGIPALDWMLKNKLASADRFSIRVFESMVSALGDAGKAMVPQYVASTSGDAALNALRLCGTYRIESVEPFLKDALLNPKLRSSAVRAAGAIKAKSAVPLLVGLADGADRRAAFGALLALEQIGSDDSAHVFATKLVSDDLPISKTAVRAIAQWPDRALEAAKALLLQTGRNHRTGIEILGEIGTDAAMALVLVELSSKDPGYRMEAVRVLAGKSRAKYGPSLEPLRQDPDADVRALTEWALRPPKP